MLKFLSHRWWIVITAVLAVLALNACGISTSGEPKTVSEIEILPLPTTPAPLPTHVPVEPTLSATAEGGTSQPAAQTTPAGGLDLTSADSNQGMQVFLDQCAVCHGADKGVGPSLGGMAERAAGRIPGMSAADYLYTSIVNPGGYVVDGYQDIMPTTYATDLSSQQINDLVAFILSFDPASMMSNLQATAGVQTTPVPEQVPQENVLTVRGQLIQGTANGEAIPAGLPMELYVVDANGNLVNTYKTTSGENGSYLFENVARAVGDVYLVNVTYSDIPQGGQLPAIQGDEKELTRDITLYQRTTDPSTIAITGAQMLINYAPIKEFGLEVWLSLEIANTGDKIVTTDQTVGTGNWFVSASMELPVGSFGIQPMQSENSQRYVVEDQNGVPVVKDTWPLRPGQAHAITIAYYLPYTDGAVIDQSFSYPVVDASVLLPNDTVSFKSDQFDVAGQWCCRVAHGGVRVTELQPDEKISPDTDFTLVKSHNLNKPIAANQRLIFELTGRPTRTLDVIASKPSSSGTNTNNILPIIMAIAGLAIIMLAVVLWWRQRKTAPPPVARSKPGHDAWQPPTASAGKEELLKAVARLDDAYESGKLDEETYQERRDLLMERLLPLMDTDEK